METTNNDSKFLDSVITTTIQPTPFSITFSWQDDTVKVELVNGEDILKLADILSKVLTENNIKHKIK